MPTTAGKVIATILTLAGINPLDAAYKDILAITTEVPDDAVTAIGSNLITVEAAKNNPAIKQHFQATVLSGMDSTLEKAFETLGLDPAIVEELKSEKNTYKRAELMATKVKELRELESKKKGTNADDSKKYADEITALNKQIADIKDASKKELDALAAKYKEEKLGDDIKNVLSNIEYAFDVPKDTNIMTAQNLLNAELANKNAKVIRDDNGKLKLVRRDDEALDYMENNLPVPFEAFTQKTLANNKFIKVTEAGGGGGNKITPTPGEAPQAHLEGVSFYEAQIAAQSK